MSRPGCVVVRLVVLGVLVAATAAAAPPEDNSFDSCLRRDSISCVQIHVYRKLRALFSQENINLVAGFQLSRNHEDTARSMDTDTNVDNAIFSENTVSDRQSALEDFIFEKVTGFFKERSFHWSLAPAIQQITSTARLALDSIPQDVKDQTTSYLTEGRMRKNKILKSIIPIIVAAKIKLVGFFTLMYLVTTVIAKKALVASLLALGITLFISLKKIWSKHYHHYPHVEYHGDPYSHGPPHPVSSGWSSGSWSGWDSYDLHGAHSSPASHHLPYSAQKPNH